MDVKKNIGKLAALSALLLVFILNIGDSALVVHFTATMNELLKNIMYDCTDMYITIAVSVIFIFPMSNILITSNALKNNTSITKKKQFIYMMHLMYCFFISHLANFTIVSFFNSHFARMTNTPISFLMCSFRIFDNDFVMKIQCVFYISSAILTSMQFLQHFIVGECAALSVILSRRIRFIPTNLRVMGELLNCYMYHTLPMLLVYIALVVRLFFILESLTPICGILYYSIATSNISIMLTLLIYWLTHGTILTANRHSVVRN